MMWHFGLFRSARPTDSRRKLSHSQQPWLKRLRAGLGWPLAIAAGFWLFATLIVLSSDEPLPYSAGQVVQQPVMSRVDFERVNKSSTDELRRKSQQAVANFFRLNQALVDRIQAEFRDLHAAVKSSEDYEKYAQVYTERWPLDQPAFDVLKLLTDEAGSEQFKRNVDTVAKRVADEEMLERADVEREIRSTASHVMLDRGDGGFRSVPKERLNYATNSSDVEALANRMVQYLFAEAIRPVLKAIIIQAISPGQEKYRAVYTFDRAHTREVIETAGLVEPVKDKYETGDRLIKAGEIKREALSLLKTEHEEYLIQRNHNPVLHARWRAKQIGLTGLTLLITVGLAVFVRRSQPRVAQKLPRALGVAGLLLMMLMFDRFVLLEIGDSPMWSVTTITMAAAILTIAYSQLFAMGTTSGLALLTVLTLRAPYSTLIVLLIVGTVTVMMLREIRTRMKMVEVGVAASAAASLGALIMALVEGQDPARGVAFAALAAMAGTSLVLVVLPIIEKVFRITTSLTLLEWADTSRPLLRQLIEKAPGTWQHSHLLGSMAETAAEEIGANGLLVRVGAYYHDVGKICKPNYFVENQQAKMNAHRGLAPTMSLLVILAHVKDGLALAREWGLPPVLHHFIAEHHGTTVVKYFHALASAEAKAGGGDRRDVSETEFRYPGPKPRTRETAILMLCDGVEGAVRSLQDPTSGRIESVVHDILMARLMDGQFDDCDITLKELARIEQCLVKSLRAIHHGRITYPSSETAEAQVRTA